MPYIPDTLNSVVLKSTKHCSFGIFHILFTEKLIRKAFLPKVFHQQLGLDVIKVTFEFRRKVFVTADKIYAFEGLGQADFKYIAVYLLLINLY